MSLTTAEVLLGSKLIAKRSDIFMKKWEREIANWQRVLQSIEKADATQEIEDKRAELNGLIALVEGAIYE